MRAWLDFAVTAIALAAIALIAIAPSAGVALAERRDWTGSAACGTCHPAELTAWQTTPHAQTRARFPTRPEGRCLACHGTGEAYAEDDVMRDRALARALGLADLATPKLRAAACAPCHRRPTRGTPFDPAAPVHAVPPRLR